MKKWTSVLLVMTLAVLSITVLPIHGEEQIYDSVIRLHVLANSDSEEDQALKLKVRDAVLARTEGLLSTAATKEEAEAILSASLAELRAVAEETVRQNGEEQGVRVTLSWEEYPTRRYEKMAFPAGEYLSLRVMLGEAEGENWWCVLFPPLCLTAATATDKENAEATFLAAGLTDEQYRIITDTDSTKYRLRFKILEVAESLFE